MSDTKTEKTVAEELREAAAKLRAKPIGLAQRHADIVTIDGQFLAFCVDCLNCAEVTSEAAGPLVALLNAREPLAAWLEDEADWLESVPEHKRRNVILSGMLDNALAVARVLNGTASQEVSVHG